MGSLSRILIFVFLSAPSVVLANFTFPEGVVIPECYEVSEKGAEPVSNKFGATSFYISSISAVPEWIEQLKLGDPLNIRVKYEVTHCRPFYIYIHPISHAISSGSAHVASFTSPSPVFDPGENMQGEYIAFTGFQRKTDSTGLVQNASIEGVKISFVDYGTSNEVAAFEFEIRATWLGAEIPPSVVKSKFNEPACITEFNWPAIDVAPQGQCENSIDFPPQAGYDVEDRLDLNADGICELIVQAEYCRKTHNNTCYLLYQERGGLFQKIFQFYNALEFYEASNGYVQVGAMEYGPNYDTYRFGEYSAGKYQSTYLRDPCEEDAAH